MRSLRFPPIHKSTILTFCCSYLLPALPRNNDNDTISPPNKTRKEQTPPCRPHAFTLLFCALSQIFLLSPRTVRRLRKWTTYFGKSAAVHIPRTLALGRHGDRRRLQRDSSSAIHGIQTRNDTIFYPKRYFTSSTMLAHLIARQVKSSKPWSGLGPMPINRTAIFIRKRNFNPTSTTPGDSSALCYSIITWSSFRLFKPILAKYQICFPRNHHFRSRCVSVVGREWILLNDGQENVCYTL